MEMFLSRNVDLGREVQGTDQVVGTSSGVMTYPPDSKAVFVKGLSRLGGSTEKSEHREESEADPSPVMGLLLPSRRHRIA